MGNRARKLAALVGITLALALGCHHARFRTGQTLPDGSLVVFSPPPTTMIVTTGLDAGSLRAAIARALASGGYAVETEEGQRIVAHGANGRAQLEIALEYTTSQVAITYVDSNEFPIEDEYTSPEYDEWMRNLTGAIQYEIERPAREAAEAQARAEQAARDQAAAEAEAQRQADEREIERQRAERLERERLATERAQAEALSAQARLGLTLPQVQGGVSVTVQGLAFDPHASIAGSVSIAPGTSASAVGGMAGGPVSASTLGLSADCPGYYPQQPQHTIVLTAPIPYLRIEAPSPGNDMTLAIVAPGGVVWCDDDSAGDLTPRIEGSFPAGTYRIFVGNYRGPDAAPYQLTLAQSQPVAPVAVAPPSELVVNGSFEADALAPGGWQTLPSITGWVTAWGPGVELQNNAAGRPADGSQLAELDSDASSAIYQDVSTIPGATYDLSFSYSPRPGIAAVSNRIDAFFGGMRVASVTAPGESLGDTHWVRVHVVVRATSTTSRLELRDTGASDTMGGYVDAVSLRGTGTAGAPAASATMAASTLALVNGDFEQPAVAPGGWQTFPMLPGWAATSGPGVEIQNHAAGTPASGAQLAELDSDASSAIAQDLATTPGARYDLGFAYSARPGCGPNPIEISFAGAVVASLDTSGDLPDTLWYQLVVPVQARGPGSRLELRDGGPSDGLGGYLDAMSIQPAAQ